MSGDEYEDGEISEEGEEIETTQVTLPRENLPFSMAKPDTVSNEQPRTGQPTGFLGTPHNSNRRMLMIPKPDSYAHGSKKRIHSEMEVSPHEPPSDRRERGQRGGKGRTTNGNGGTHNGDRGDYEERYNADILLKYPRQVVQSNVLLDFVTWMEARARLRLDIVDIQTLLLHAIDKNQCTSPFLMESLFPHKEMPTKICVIVLGNVHPAVLQRYRPQLPFFDSCTTLPLSLTKPDAALRVETPLPELLYRFAKPPVESRDMPVEELFYGHELTFLMTHSFGYNDELLLQPHGKFRRMSQPQGGTWHLDGDLLHLKWRQHTNTILAECHSDGEDSTDRDVVAIDVLVAEDATMHYFSTDPDTDRAYARTTTPSRPNEKARSIRLSLVKVTVADVSRTPDGSVDRSVQPNHVPTDSIAKNYSDMQGTITKPSWNHEKFDQYVLSIEELRHHGYPVDIHVEQATLNAETNSCTRDQFVTTIGHKRMGDEDKSLQVLAVDCEMCETDLGFELTRVTLVNVHNEVVYDHLVKPQSTIINYHTEFSGITAATLESTRHILADVQRDLLQHFLYEDTVLVGHSLTSDLRALRLVHLNIIDTAILYPHQRGFPFKTSLKGLSRTFLRKDIQTLGQEGHDSAEDAIAAMELVLAKVQNGPTYGLPETMTNRSAAYDTLLDKLAERKKRMSMIQFRHATSATNSHVIQDKPWQQYASGELQTHAQSPYAHAHIVLAKREEGDEANDQVPHGLSQATMVDSWDALVSDVREANARADDVLWVEIHQAGGHRVANEFLDTHHRWMEKQFAYCTTMDRTLQRIKTECASPGTLFMVIPQGDISMLRYLKGLRTRAKWKDASPAYIWNDEKQAAVGDAMRGTMNSCVFLMQS